MELKNAIAVCLISLFSATLVVLIARALDSQAAARLEPQLAAIVGELQAIRKQGGIAAGPVAPGTNDAVENGLIVYYFHGNTRCLTCQAIESQSSQAVDTDFRTQLDSGSIVWRILNYEQPAGSPLAKKFEVQMPVVVLARMKAGQVDAWKRLDEVWGLVDDKPAFAKFLSGEIRKMLGTSTATSQFDAAQPAKSPVASPSSLPLPAPSAKLPLPK